MNMANLTGQEQSGGCGGHGGSTVSHSEEQLATLVRVFYESAKSDEMLAPVFSAAINDWDSHLVIVQDFWSHALLGTSRYKGHPFPPHMSLPIEPEHFDRWLSLFKVAADQTLPPEAASRAKARAIHMTDSFRVGLFPFVGADGRPSRLPPKRPA
jgi:hemoglobin